MDVTMDIEVEHQITEPEQQLALSWKPVVRIPQWRRLTQQKKSK